METIIDYLHIGASYYRTVQKPLASADPMVMLLPGGKTQCGRILNPNGTIGNDKDYGTKAPGITYIGIAVCLRFFAEPAMFRPCRNSLAPLMLSHSGGSFEDLGKTGLSYINIYTPIYFYLDAKNNKKENRE